MTSITMEVGNYDYGGYKVVIVAAILIFMQISMVSGRLFSRRLQKVWLGIDDYVLISATVATITLCGLAIAFPRITGVSSWSLQQSSNSKPAGQAAIAWLVLYGISVALSKLAILLLYLRVFTSQRSGFTFALVAVGIIVIGTGIANTFIAIFQCSPVPYAWDKEIASGKCFDEIKFARFMAIPNVIDGFIMLVMPIPLVWQLELAIQQKIALTATFLHGIIGFVASVARLAILFQTNVMIDTRTTAIVWTIWTINEPANYIIAACLPTLRPIFVCILPESFFILTRKRDSSGDAKQATSTGSPTRITWSWPKGRRTPKITLVSTGASRLTGPWERSRFEDEEMSTEQKAGTEKTLQVSEREVTSAY